ncbi:MAG: DUF3575 domain-containing protein [Rikenellaceae bacterium]
MISKVQIFRFLVFVAVLFSATFTYAADEVLASSESKEVELLGDSAEGEDGQEAVEEEEKEPTIEDLFPVLKESFLFTFSGDNTDLDHTDELYVAQKAKLDTLLKVAPIQERDVVNVVATTSFDIYMSFLTNLSISSAYNLREKFLLDYPEVDPAQVKSYYYCNPWMRVADKLEADAPDFVEREDILDIMRSNDNPYAIEYLLKALYSSSVDAWLFIDQAMSDITRYGLIFIDRDGLEQVAPIYLNDSSSIAERLPEDEDLAAVRESFDSIYLSTEDILVNEEYFRAILEVEEEEVDEETPADSDFSDGDSLEVPTVLSVAEDVIEDEVEDPKIAVLALKTNMLFDLVSLINAEIEVPIGEKFSIAGEWIFPWWIMDNSSSSSRRNRAQTLTGTIEARWWLGNRDERARLTHWFVGAYGSMGVYDFEYDHIGYQSEKKYYNVGLSVGYAHQVAKRLRLEYSLGVGYMQTRFNKYEAVWSDVDSEWKAMRTDSGSLGWFGPTRAKVSLSVAINKASSKMKSRANSIELER